MLFDLIIIFCSQLIVYIETTSQSLSACFLLLLLISNYLDYYCSNEYFSCDQHRCIPRAFVCNGEYNCQDKTDETNCSTTIINQRSCSENLSVKCQQDILYSTRSIEHNIHSEYIHPIEICIHRYDVVVFS